MLEPSAPVVPQSTSSSRPYGARLPAGAARNLSLGEQFGSLFRFRLGDTGSLLGTPPCVGNSSTFCPRLSENTGGRKSVQCRAATLERQALLGTACPAPRGAIVRRPSDGKLLQHFGVDEKATNKHTKKTRKNTRKKHGRCPILPDDDCSGLTQARLDANPLLSTRGAL